MWALDKQRVEIVIPPRFIALLALKFGLILAFNHAVAASVWNYLHEAPPACITTFDKSKGSFSNDGLVHGLCFSLQYAWPSSESLLQRIPFNVNAVHLCTSFVLV
jgi:hypothetical protein